MGSTACPGKIFTVEMHHKKIEKGYSPIGHVRCGRAACRLVKIVWKMGKDTGGEKADGGTELKTNDAAGIVLVPQQPMVVDTFENCEGLARIAFLDGNSAVMLGKVDAVNLAKDWD